MTLTDQQRSAQRTLIGLVLRSGSARLERDIGLCLFREHLESDFTIGATELTDHLETLEIPYSVVVGYSMRFGKRTVKGFDVRVAWDDLATVTRWMPSLQKHIDAVAG